MSLRSQLRQRAWLARFSFLLWLAFAIGISLASWHLFPDAHFWVDGGIQGIKLVVLVDLVLGPVLFFLVAHPEKSARLRRLDSIVLFSIQLAAIAWGSWQVFTQRPVAISHLEDGYAVPLIPGYFRAQNVTLESLPASAIGHLPAFRATLPRGGALAALQEMINSGIPVAARARFLSPLLDHREAVFGDEGRFHRYLQGPGQALWAAWVADHPGRAPADYHYLVLAGRHGNALLLLDRDYRYAGHLRLPGEGIPPELLPPMRLPDAPAPATPPPAPVHAARAA
ncbi:MAG: hypothetical protein ACK4UT_06320 [Moraxellaceae bacterium]